jgi:hypothetical protein
VPRGRLARRTFYGMARWQAALEQKQAFLGRIVDIGAELFAMSAVCACAEALQSRDEAQGASAYLLAEAFCEQSRMRVARLFRMLGRDTDTLDRAVAGAVLDGAATWLERGVLERGVLEPSEGTGPWISRRMRRGGRRSAREGGTRTCVVVPGQTGAEHAERGAADEERGRADRRE